MTRDRRVVRCAPAVLAGLLLVAACGEARTSTGPTSDDRAPVGDLEAAGAVAAWQMLEGEHDGTALPVLADHPVTLTVDESTFGGRSGCNGYGGDVVAGVLQVRAVGGTEMACEPGVMALEAAYLDALAATDGRVRVDADRLVLAGGTTSLTFVPVPPVPTAELVGTTWTLESLVEGGTASSAVSSPVGDRSTLVLRSDGTVEATTGCRTLTGRWVERGAEVLLTESAMEGSCPAGPGADQDDHVVAVLGDGFRATVDGETLTLSDAGGAGLVYRAG